jgi:uncharacterized membrane protein YdfJ with MMPL/SSD domain
VVVPSGCGSGPRHWHRSAHVPHRPPAPLAATGLVALAWLAAAGPLNVVGGRLTSLQENDNAAFLPDSAESTRVTELQQRFQREPSLP